MRAFQFTPNLLQVSLTTTTTKKTVQWMAWMDGGDGGIGGCAVWRHLIRKSAQAVSISTVVPAIVIDWWWSVMKAKNLT